MEAPPPPRIARPVMYHHWRWITFLHWRYPPAVVQRLLPPGLTAETAPRWPDCHLNRKFHLLDRRQDDGLSPVIQQKQRISVPKTVDMWVLPS